MFITQGLLDALEAASHGPGEARFHLLQAMQSLTDEDQARVFNQPGAAAFIQEASAMLEARTFAAAIYEAYSRLLTVLLHDRAQRSEWGVTLPQVLALRAAQRGDEVEVGADIYWTVRPAFHQSLAREEEALRTQIASDPDGLQWYTRDNIARHTIVRGLMAATGTILALAPVVVALLERSGLDVVLAYHGDEVDLSAARAALAATRRITADPAQWGAWPAMCIDLVGACRMELDDGGLLLLDGDAWDGDEDQLTRAWLGWQAELDANRGDDTIECGVDAPWRAEDLADPAGEVYPDLDGPDDPRVGEAYARLNGE